MSLVSFSRCVRRSEPALREIDPPQLAEMCLNSPNPDGGSPSSLGPERLRRLYFMFLCIRKLSSFFCCPSLPRGAPAPPHPPMLECSLSVQKQI